MKEKEIRLAVFGVGNCASSLVQAIVSSREYDDRRGLESPVIGGYKLGDVRLILAYDVSTKKIGYDIQDAIAAEPNCTTTYINVGRQNVEISPGLLSDGLDGPLSSIIDAAPVCRNRTVSDIEYELRASHVDVAVCFLPAGSRNDVRSYAVAACRAGVAFINACSEEVVHDAELRAMFERANLPLMGDDMKSHVGATAIHTLLVEFLRSRNITLDNTYQLNVGGNADFRNLNDHNRASSKRISKRAALNGAGIDVESELLAGPVGFVPFLRDRKTAFIRLECASVLGMKLNVDVRVDVEDSPNIVSIIADSIRIAALTRQSLTSSAEPCSHLFKNPLIPLPHSEAQTVYRRFVNRLNGEDSPTSI